MRRTLSDMELKQELTEALNQIQEHKDNEESAHQFAVLLARS